MSNAKERFHQAKTVALFARLLAGAMIVVGVYLFLDFAYGFFWKNNHSWSPLIKGLFMVSIGSFVWLRPMKFMSGRQLK